MRSKTPELEAYLAPRRVALQDERKQIVEKAEALHQKRAALLERIQPLEKELREVDDQIHEIEQPRLQQIGNELAAIERMLGAISLDAEPFQEPVKE